MSHEFTCGGFNVYSNCYFLNNKFVGMCLKLNFYREWGETERGEKTLLEIKKGRNRKAAKRDGAKWNAAKWDVPHA